MTRVRTIEIHYPSKTVIIEDVTGRFPQDAHRGLNAVIYELSDLWNSDRLKVYGCSPADFMDAIRVLVAPLRSEEGYEVLAEREILVVRIYSAGSDWALLILGDTCFVAVPMGNKD